jgi:Mg-chelatase subunit ChlD
MTRLVVLVLLLCCAGSAAAQTAEPLSGVIVVDTSTSVDSLSGSEGRKFLEAFGRFAQAGGGRDRFSVVRVSTQASLYLEPTEDAARVTKSLSKLLSKREVSATALYDGCALALKQEAGGGQGRRFLLVLSDGLDTTSELPLKDLEALLKESGVKLFAVELPNRERVGGSPGPRNLEALAKASGGAVFRPKKGADFDTMLAGVRSALGR